MYVDLFVMAKCRHHILHNSTLSAWVAFLSDQKGKVYYNNPGFEHIHGKDAVAKEWIDGEPFKKRVLKKIKVWTSFEALRWRIKEIRRDFLHRYFNIYYVLDHEEGIYKEKK